MIENHKLGGRNIMKREVNFTKIGCFHHITFTKMLENIQSSKAKLIAIKLIGVVSTGLNCM